VTDLGIELGRLLYWNRDRDASRFVRADRDRIAVLAGLLAAFLGGAITGAFGFKLAGYVSTVPLAIVLVLLAVVPVVDDLRRAARAHGG
jgi:hypothetical protein